MYFLVIIQNAGYSNPSQAIYKYDTIDAALAAYHTELAYRADARHLTSCVILDRDGFSIYRDTWERQIETDQFES